jgi:copper resistance protein C
MFVKSLCLGSACIAAAIVATPAQAHAKLQSSDPASGSILAAAPKEVRLKFNEALEPTFSTIKVTDGKNAEVKLQHAVVEKSDPSVLAVALPPLVSGTYHVRWSTMTRDSHKTKGEFIFQVK